MSTTKDIEIEANTILAPLEKTQIKSIKYKISTLRTSVIITFSNGKKLHIHGAKMSHIELELV